MSEVLESYKINNKTVLCQQSVLCIYNKCREESKQTPLTSQYDSSNTGNISRKTGGSKQERLENWRQKFLSGLQSEGLEMEDVRNVSSFCQQL